MINDHASVFECALIFLLLQLLFGSAFSHWHDNDKSADFIIIGGQCVSVRKSRRHANVALGGTAGLTVAARLVEANFSVLLFEAGGHPNEYPWIPWKSPALTGSMTSIPSVFQYNICPIL